MLKSPPEVEDLKATGKVERGTFTAEGIMPWAVSEGSRTSIRVMSWPERRGQVSDELVRRMEQRQRRADSPQ